VGIKLLLTIKAVLALLKKESKDREKGERRVAT
jgi:hypothetical protein